MSAEFAMPTTFAAPTPVAAAPTPVAAAPTPVAAAPTPVAAAPTPVAAPASVAAGSRTDPGVQLGYRPSRGDVAPLWLGPGEQLRSGTVLYDGSTIGERFQTGHGVVIREECSIGDDVSVWSNTVVDYGCRIGDRVKIHCNCYVAQFTELGPDVFLAPGVTIANDLYPGDRQSAELMSGPVIGAGAQIGVNVTILPFVRIGAGALIGAGSVVTRDIPAGMVAYGSPAVVRGRVEDLRGISERVVGDASSVSRHRLAPPTDGPGTAGGEPRTEPTSGVQPTSRVTAGNSRRRWSGVVKRAVDVTASGSALVLLSPLLLAIWLAVRLTSPGPGFFRQERLGRDEEPFVILKFRTMEAECGDELHRRYVTRLLTENRSMQEPSGQLFKLTQDPRVTRLGAVLRRSSLDELPQLWNVLRGDMSLVGPRPVLPWEAQLFGDAERRRFEVRPGITGLWQVSGRNRLTMREALSLDVEYVRRWSTALDLAIIVRTIPAVLRGGAR